MTTGAELIADAFGRVREIVHDVADGLSPEQLAERLEPGANSIAWLVWHLTRVQDSLAETFGAEQVWTAEGWDKRFDLPFSSDATGYGQGAEQVGAVRVQSAELLTGYHDAVHRRMIEYIQGLGEADFERVVDTNWDPPVTLGVRLVSVVSDALQHAGQTAFVRGVLERRGK